MARRARDGGQGVPLSLHMVEGSTALTARPFPCGAPLPTRAAVPVLPCPAQAAFLASFRERADALSGEVDAHRAAHKEVRRQHGRACSAALPCCLVWLWVDSLLQPVPCGACPAAPLQNACPGPASDSFKLLPCFFQAHKAVKLAEHKIRQLSEALADETARKEVRLAAPPCWELLLWGAAWGCQASSLTSS